MSAKNESARRARSVTGSPGATRDGAASISNGAGRVVDQPAHHLAPEGLVGDVIDGDARIHAPQPRILHREHGAHAAPVALPGEHRHIRAAALDLAGQQHRGAGAQGAGAVHRRQRRQRIPPRARGRPRGAQLQRGERLAGARRPDLQRGRGAVHVLFAARECHRQHVGQRRVGEPALGHATRGRRAPAGRHRGGSRSRRSCAVDRPRRRKPRCCPG